MKNKNISKYIICLLIVVFIIGSLVACDKNVSEDKKEELVYDWSDFNFPKICAENDIAEAKRWIEKVNEYEKHEDYRLSDLAESCYWGDIKREIVDETFSNSADYFGEGFYDLQEGYDLGFITKNDLRSISYRMNENRGYKGAEYILSPTNCGVYNSSTYNRVYVKSDYQPLPKSPEVVDETTINKIKEQVLEGIKNNEKFPSAELGDITFVEEEYCGSYNGYMAIVLTVHSNTWNFINGFTRENEITIEGVAMKKPYCGNFPVLWKIS